MPIRGQIRRVSAALRGAIRTWAGKRFFPPMRPTIQIVGAQKGGTSSLAEYLAWHPHVVAPLMKEINFFQCDGRFARGNDFYHTHFALRTPARARGVTFEATPGYLRHADKVASRIHAYDADTRVIALLRNPVTRAFSGWQMYRRSYRVNRDWFLQWQVDQESGQFPESFLRRPETFGDSFDADVRFEMDALERGESVEMPVLDFGFYHRQLVRFLDVFPREQVFVAQSEEFFERTTDVLPRVEEFLGLPPFAWPADRLRPLNAGQYEDGIKSGTRSLLRQFYESENDRLFGLLAEEYNWD